MQNTRSLTQLEAIPLGYSFEPVSISISVQVV
jgi:hypothetical protein